jgi:hypothetical protein
LGVHVVAIHHHDELIRDLAGMCDIEHVLQ